MRPPRWAHIEITCAFCDEAKTVPLNLEGFRAGSTAYMVHLIESHWDKLEECRQMRLATGVPVNDAWTRI